MRKRGRRGSRGSGRVVETFARCLSVVRDDWWWLFHGLSWLGTLLLDTTTVRGALCLRVCWKQRKFSYN